jgi:hypothetical protein
MQFESAAGVPLSGGRVYTYTAGTTTPQATFTDASGATPNPNPIILNSRGEASIWLGSGIYKFKLTDANDVEIWTVDYISAPTSGASPVLSGNVVIDSDTPNPALKITQLGTGAALRVQDSVDPDVTPFIIDGTGQVGIGTATPSAQLEATGAARLGSLTLTSTPLPAGSGGTGRATLTANNVLLGDGTNAVKLIAPGTANNVLVSNGTTWASAIVPDQFPSQTGNAGKALITNGTAISWDTAIARGTATVISGSPTTVPFTGIPSWARRVTIALSLVAKSSTANLLVQIGSTTYTTSGYDASGGQMFTTGATNVNSTAGFIFYTNAASAVLSGSVELINLTGNTWVASGIIGNASASGQSMTTVGTVSLGGVLDRIRLNTVGGTETFTSGTVNVFWE